MSISPEDFVNWLAAEPIIACRVEQGRVVVTAMIGGRTIKRYEQPIGTTDGESALRDFATVATQMLKLAVVDQVAACRGEL